MTAIELYSWYAMVVMEALLLWQWRFSDWPAFRLFLAYSVPRDFLLVILSLALRSAYVGAWTYTEPACIGLLAAVSTEAEFAVLDRRMPAAWLWSVAVAISALSAAWYVIGGFSGIYTARVVVDACAVSLVFLTMILRARWSTHAAILLAFLIIDLIGYAAVLIGVPHYRPEAWIMLGQAACFLAWLKFRP